MTTNAKVKDRVRFNQNSKSFGTGSRVKLKAKLQRVRERRPRIRLAFLQPAGLTEGSRCVARFPEGDHRITHPRYKKHPEGMQESRSISFTSPCPSPVPRIPSSVI